jgi:hypothetical protein
MLFLRFHADDNSEWVFAGGREAILADTKGGTAFAFVRFSACTEMTLHEVRQIGFRYYDNALAAPDDGSYLVGILDEHGKPTEPTRKMVKT